MSLKKVASIAIVIRLDQRNNLAMLSQDSVTVKKDSLDSSVRNVLLDFMAIRIAINVLAIQAVRLMTSVMRPDNATVKLWSLVSNVTSANHQPLDWLPTMSRDARDVSASADQIIANKVKCTGDKCDS